jgi:hypothetical protein
MLFREAVAIHYENRMNTIYKDSVRTSQETHYVYNIKRSRLMLFRGTVTDETIIKNT